MMYAGLPLARRIEAAEAANARACQEGQPGAAFLEIAGGVAVFAGAESPLTQVVGIGLNGPVHPTEIKTIEAFFRCRGARVTIDFCPLADPGLLQLLSERGFRATEFNNVLVKPLEGAAATPAPRVRRALPEESDLWSRTVGEGFFEQAELTGEEMDVGRAVFSMAGSLCYLAAAETRETAGGAAMAVRGGLAILFADGVITRFRRQGCHRELIAARLNDAGAQGCDLAVASTLPGSPSQRNYTRAGFQVAYTKVTLVGG
jgi:GNAT superfamily N-acetyltransferase